MLIETLGFLAAILTTFAAVPQLIKVIRTKSAKDISIVTLIMTGTGILCWLVYGILISSMPLIAANSFSILVGFFIIFFKYKYDRAIVS